MQQISKKDSQRYTTKIYYNSLKDQIVLVKKKENGDRGEMNYIYLHMMKIIIKQKPTDYTEIKVHKKNIQNM